MIKENFDPITLSVVGIGLGLGFGGVFGSKAVITNKIENRTIATSDLKLLNDSTNKFVVDAIIKLASSCTATRVLYAETRFGDVISVGKDSVAEFKTDREQDADLNFVCLQQSIQEIQVGTSIAQSIMNDLTQSIDTQALNKLVSEANAKLETGFLANPFASASSSINLDLKNIQEFETRRELENVIVNTVENNINIESIKECIDEIALSVLEQGGNIIAIDGGVSRVSLKSSQVAKSLFNCQQLNEQTSTITNQLMANLGLRIVDDTKVKIETEVESKAKAEVKAVGLEGVIAALLNPLILSIISVILLVIVGGVAFYYFFMKGGEDGEDKSLKGFGNFVAGKNKKK